MKKYLAKLFKPKDFENLSNARLIAGYKDYQDCAIYIAIIDEKIQYVALIKKNIGVKNEYN